MDKKVWKHCFICSQRINTTSKVQIQTAGKVQFIHLMKYTVTTLVYKPTAQLYPIELYQAR